MPVWVDFGFVGSEDGSYENPFDTLTEGLTNAAPSATIRVRGDTGAPVSNETMTIDQVVMIEAVNGAVNIGGSGRKPETPRRSGFVSRD